MICLENEKFPRQKLNEGFNKSSVGVGGNNFLSEKGFPSFLFAEKSMHFFVTQVLVILCYTNSIGLAVGRGRQLGKKLSSSEHLQCSEVFQSLPDCPSALLISICWK